MPSDLQITNIKDQANANSAITIASDGQITVNQNNPTLTLGSNATGFTGIKNVDVFILNTDLTGAQNPIQSQHFTRATSSNGGANFGTGVTLHGSGSDAGVFTFPSTGFWRVESGLSFTMNDKTRYCFSKIDYATNGKTGSFNGRAFGRAFINSTNMSSGVIYSSSYMTAVFDVTTAGDTGSSSAVRFVLSGEKSHGIMSNTSGLLSWFMFTRLGDT